MASDQNQIPREEQSGKDEGGSEIEGLNVEEPSGPARLSPYAIAALVVSALGLWMTTQVFFPPAPTFSWRLAVLGWLPQALPSIAASIVALVIATRAEGEVLLSEGRLGGVGFYRTARLIAFATLAILVLSFFARSAGGDPFASTIEFPEPPATPEPPPGFDAEGFPVVPSAPARPP